VLVVGATDDPGHREALAARGADLLALPGANGKVDLGALLRALAARGINELHVEAGHKLNASLLREGLVDELLVYLAPKLIGIGREMAAFGPLESLAEAIDFRYVDFALVGDDLRLRARPPGRDAF
ncbi:MAG: dihydrofolate reductase family protein, partial [Burkholderiales bacterium]|nr:dihydrofolate reductase family protein [Burkholderiales bacterium]